MQAVETHGAVGNRTSTNLPLQVDDLPACAITMAISSPSTLDWMIDVNRLPNAGSEAS